MTKKMLIDATHAEETRVVVLDGNRLEDYDVETSTKKQLKGNIYLAKVVRVEPSLQAAFVEYGGNRHGFLAFSEIHPDYYQIPVADRERLIALQAQEAEAEEEEDEAEEARAPAAPLTAEAEPAVTAEPELSEPEYSPPEETHGEEPSTDSQAVAEAIERGVDTAPEAAEPLEAHEPDHAQHDFHYEGDPGTAQIETIANDAPPPEVLGGGSEESAEDVRPRRENMSFLRNYKIQEVIRRRQILLIQVVKEERGTKGAALTTYISLAGRFSVLMPNSPRGGGISRKITSIADRRRLREVARELEIPKGMGLIIRTAGAARPKPEIKRDGEYLLRLWDDIRELTLKSTAPALIYEEASLIKRAIRDVYSRDLDEIVVDGEPGWRSAQEFMRMLMPTHARKVILWKDPAQSLFARHQVESQIDAMLSPNVQLRSGGYLVINQTEALVAIDVNSGRATRERDISDTALRTNLEAADELARQLRLRDLAGLIVVDFIDMELKKHNAQVERRVKEALKNDRARIQVGHISHFGLLEMSRQRLRPSIAETSSVLCPHCGGTGHMRSTESSALHVLRAVEEEGSKRRSAEILVHVAPSIALYMLNHKRERLSDIELRCAMRVTFAPDDTLVSPNHRIEKLRTYGAGEAPPPVTAQPTAAEPENDAEEISAEEEDVAAEENGASPQPQAGQAAQSEGEEGEKRRRRRRRRRRRGGREDQSQSHAQGFEAGGEEDEGEDEPESSSDQPEHVFELTAIPSDAFVPRQTIAEPTPAFDLATAPQPDLPDLPPPPITEQAPPVRAPRKRPPRKSAASPQAELSEEPAPEAKKPRRRAKAAKEPAHEELLPTEPELVIVPVSLEIDTETNVEPIAVEHPAGGTPEPVKPILVDATLAVERKRGWWSK